MDTIEKYLSVVPLPVLLFGPVAALAVFMLVPGRMRLPLSLAFMIFWMPFSQYQELGLIAAVAKVTGFAVYLLVTVAAVLDDGPKRDIPGAAWMYVFTAVQSFLYVLTVVDFTLAMAMRVQWLMLVVAAIAVVRTIVDEASLKRVIGSLALGYGLALLVPLSALVRDFGGSFRAGRFEPYTINANHIGAVLAFSAPLLVYFGMRSSRRMLKYVALGVAASAIGMGVLTASRSTAVVMLGTMFPLFAGGRRAMMAFAAIGVLVLGALIFGVTEGVHLERLQSLETGRFGILAEFLGIIAERPIFGLMGTEGLSFEGATEIGLQTTNPHNGYIVILYIGGLSWALPIFGLVAYTMWCTYTVWRQRHWLGTDPLLVNVLCAMMMMIYAHGFVNHTLITPTTELAFIHVLLSLTLIAVASDVRKGVEYPLAPMDGYEEWDSDDQIEFAAEPAY